MGEAGRCLLPIGVICEYWTGRPCVAVMRAASFSMAAWVAGAWRRGEDERIDLGRLWRLRW